MIINDIIIVGGILIISGIAIKYIIHYHDLKRTLRSEVVLAEAPLVIAEN